MDVNIKQKAFKESVFKAYDIRGLYPEELDHNTLELIAAGFAEFIKKSEKSRVCLLGQDIRESSEEISEIIEKELRKRGLDVVKIGQATTPLFTFAMGQSKAAAGIMITASHNPVRYNGLKMYRGTQGINEKTGLAEIKNMILSGLPKAEGPKGEVSEKDFLEDYVAFLARRTEFKRTLKVVFDPGGGAVCLVLPKLLKVLKNLDAKTLFSKVDSSFTSREPNPLLPQAQIPIREEILKNKADAGFLFDPDGDRLIVLDERGEVVRGDAILWLLAKKLVHPGEGVVYDYIRTSRSLVEELRAVGIKCHKSRVGYSFIKEVMHEEDAVLGGEYSGHYYFKDFFFSESALLAVIKILEILSKSSKKLSELLASYFRYILSGEINFIVKDKEKIISALEKKYPDAERDYFDGAMFQYPDWWFSVRPSNTEDLLRLVVEAKTKTLFDEKKDEVMSFLFSKGAKLA